MKVKSSNLKGKTPGEEEVEHVEGTGKMPGEEEVEHVEGTGKMPGEEEVEHVEGTGKMRGEEDMLTPISKKNFGEIYRATADKQPKKSSNLKGMMPGEEEAEQIEDSGKMPGEL